MCTLLFPPTHPPHSLCSSYRKASRFLPVNKPCVVWYAQGFSFLSSMMYRRTYPIRVESRRVHRPYVDKGLSCLSYHTTHDTFWGNTLPSCWHRIIRLLDAFWNYSNYFRSPLHLLSCWNWRRLVVPFTPPPPPLHSIRFGRPPLAVIEFSA